MVKYNSFYCGTVVTLPVITRNFYFKEKNRFHFEKHIRALVYLSVILGKWNSFNFCIKMAPKLRSKCIFINISVEQENHSSYFSLIRKTLCLRA